MVELELLPAENAELKNKVNELRYENDELKERLNNISKEEAQLLYKIQKCKIELKQKDLKKTGKTTKYTYFELSDFVPQLEQILYDNMLGSFFKIENKKATLTVFDSETGISHKWTTECIYTKEVKENAYDVGIHMKNEQAIQTYARRTLYLQAFDILEPNEIESQDKPSQTSKKQVKKTKTHPNSWKHTLKPQKDKVQEVTAERVQDILKQAEQTLDDYQKDKADKDKVPFTWDYARSIIRSISKNEQEYNACKNSLVFQKANTIPKGGINK